MQCEVQNADKSRLTEMIEQNFDRADPALLDAADAARRAVYGDKVYIRGLIEFSNYCRNDCYYCGINHGNRDVHRYRLSEEEILSCCATGYNLGFRTFVLQSGEDPYYDKEVLAPCKEVLAPCKEVLAPCKGVSAPRDRMTALIRSIKSAYPDCALTLSLGEKSDEAYRAYFQAGADRYLLRHEAAAESLYARIHPQNLTLPNRKQCLFRLKEIGFQVGAGFMVGLPGQTAAHLAEDLLFIKELQPHMVGIGPFIPHRDTRYAHEKAGGLKQTLVMMALTRLMLPEVLLPSTTALGTIAPDGRELGLRAGGNVVMPNLSPAAVRKDYALYDNKASTGEEAAESVQSLCRRIESAGYRVDFGRGDHCGVARSPVSFS